MDLLGWCKHKIYNMTHGSVIYTLSIRNTIYCDRSLKEWSCARVHAYLINFIISRFFLSLWGIVSSNLFVLVTLYFQQLSKVVMMYHQYTIIVSVWFPFVPFIFHLRCTAYSFLLVQNTLHFITGSGVQLIYMQQRRLKM